MIVVFVVDTSPSMGRAAVGESGLSRLDVAKMAVEDFVRQWRKMRASSSNQFLQEQRSFANIGQIPGPDHFLLLSTSRQHPDTASCAAGGRLLVGFATASEYQQESTTDPAMQEQRHSAEIFQKELKGLKVSKVDPNKPWPEDAGGAIGLNAALSVGLQQLSRFRLLHRETENFGMGRLPNLAIPLPTGGPAGTALQSACLVLLTDGACLRHPPKQGGGPLQLHFGAQPLREFYKEPFRWDQRIFIQAIGARDGVSSTQYLHPQLRTLCEVTGGAHWAIRGSNTIHNATDALLKRILPPMPKVLPIPDPLFAKIGTTVPHSTHTITIENGTFFVNGGPVCIFQCLPGEEDESPSTLRAALFYVASCATTSAQQDAKFLSPPIFCIPESFFPSKKLDTLPPRSAQPTLFYSKYSTSLGSKSFDPMQVIKMLHRLDQMIAANRKAAGQPVRLLHRDVYVCDWIDPDGGKTVQVSIKGRHEYYPVIVPGALRPTLSDDGENYLNIGILHVPANSSTLATQVGANRLATLTLLPPEPHILLPLLIRAAEAEHRALKKVEANSSSATGGATSALIQKQAAAKMVVPVDEHWRTEFRAYLFRLPPYYQSCLKRCLRPILPSSAHSLLHVDAAEALALQCFSKLCLQKIRSGEQVAKDSNERLDRQEASLRRSNMSVDTKREEGNLNIGYGQYDPRTTVDSYLAALQHLPAPWRVQGAMQRGNSGKKDIAKSESGSALGDVEIAPSEKSALDVLGDLPTSCLMAYYESRRRWIFGGPGLSTRGLHCEGVRNDGSNSQHCGPTINDVDECPLTLAGVGVTTLNKTSTTKMGEYRERLLFSRSPVVGYGSNDSAGVSVTTAVDGSPTWSVDDDAMPMTFFNPKTGEFSDSVQARVRSKLLVNFGNPYKEKRADSLIPEQYLSQAPSMQQGGFGSAVGSPRTPPGSPPHESFDSMEEGEAIFVRTSPSRKSPKREEFEEATPPPPAKRSRAGSDDSTQSETSVKNTDKKPPPPKPAAPSAPPPKKPAATTSKQPPPPRRPSVVPPPPPPPGKKGPPKPPKPGTAKNAAKVPPPPRPPPQQSPKSQPKGDDKKNTATKESSTPTAAAATTPKPVNTPNPTTSTTTAAPATSLSPQDLEQPDVKPNVDLPPGWMCVWSKSQKRWYFFDTKSNKSVWTWPP